MEKHLNIFIYLMLSLFISSCAKQDLLTKPSNPKLASEKAVKPYYYPGTCPYPCADLRCKGYINYCGATPVSLQTQVVTDVNVKNTMISTFQNLAANGVNLAELSRELGLPYTIQYNDIDFVNIVMTSDANNPGGKAITANFKSNSNTNNTGFGFTMFTNGSTMIKPTIVKTSKTYYLKYFDLYEGLIITISNYASSNYAFSSVYGSYVTKSTVNSTPSYIVRPPSPYYYATNPCGQATMNCMTDLYSNRGWISVWASIQTAFIPQTAVAVAATCAIHMCLM